MPNPPVGQGLRDARGIWARATNAQQRKLVGIYDAWAIQVKRELKGAVARGYSVPMQQVIVDRWLPLLRDSLSLQVAAGVEVGRRVVLEGRPITAAIAFRTGELVKEAQGLVMQNLVPGIGETLKESLARGVTYDTKALTEAFNSVRNRPAQYAGGTWLTIFEVKREVGLADMREGRITGEKPKRVRWVLDPLAVHCVAAGDFRGCVDLAGEYDSWEELPTVPAGHVTCRGSCRCHLEVEVNGQWLRGY